MYLDESIEPPQIKTKSLQNVSPESFFIPALCFGHYAANQAAKVRRTGKLRLAARSCWVGTLQLRSPVRNPKQTFSEGAGEKDAGGDRRRRRGRGEERDGWWPAAGTGGRRRGRQGQATADGGGRTPWAEQPPAEQPPTGPLAFPSPGRPLTPLLGAARPSAHPLP